MPLYASPSLFIRKIGKSGMWRGGLPRRHRSTIFQSVYEKLKECKADILITHEAPSMHPKGFKALDDLAVKWVAKLSFTPTSMKASAIARATDSAHAESDFAESLI